MKKLIYVLVLGITLLGCLPALADGGDPIPTKPPVGNVR